MIELMVTYIFNNIAAKIPLSVIYSHNDHIYASPKSLQLPPIDTVYTKMTKTMIPIEFFIFRPK